MSKLFTRVGDRLLGYVLPRSTAAAGTFIGCCDYSVCKYREANSRIVCTRCFGQCK